MIKKFSSPKIKIWFEPMFFFGFFCGFRLAERGDNFKFFFDGKNQIFAKRILTMYQFSY